MIVWDFEAFGTFGILASTGSFWLFTIQKLYSQGIFDYLAIFHLLRFPSDLRGFFKAQARGVPLDSSCSCQPEFFFCGQIPNRKVSHPEGNLT